ncbi:hypothetical protein GCM10023088_57120 [Actinomadura verrucosospora]|uniref:hypothetical protein n=1 Tax=Actinomadura verrucosospora TaxID=46165 RepID=UPI0031F0E08E
MIRWAGLLLILLGAGHTLGGLLLTAGRHADSWFTGRLWRPEEGITDMSSAMAAFWLTLGSFGVPLAVVGMIVLWLDRRGLGWGAGWRVPGRRPRCAFCLFV